MALLEVRDLKTHFHASGGLVRAVDGISFSLSTGEVLALVGESGSGKSVTSLSIMGLIAAPGFRAGGSIGYGELDLSSLPEKEWLKLRGKEIGLIFQDPMNALNPVMSCGDQVAEGMRLHLGLGKPEARARARKLFQEVGIPDPDRRLDEYPHQMSGGMRQRVVIAMALACGPRILIADEPTTALDVTVQAQILDLLIKEQADRDMGILLITHDLGVVAETADRVAVMYAGKIVETAPVAELFAHPRHPYTRALLDAVPSLADDIAEYAGAARSAAAGSAPDPLALPSGCRFHPRCPRASELCARIEPAFDGRAACHHPLEASP